MRSLAELGRLATAKLVVDIIEGLARAYKAVSESRSKDKDQRIKQLEKELAEVKKKLEEVGS